MLLIDHRHLIDDVTIHILNQLHPIALSDRYALLSCLLVSRRFFKFAAPILWSLQKLDLNSPASSVDFLFKYAVANDPPTTPPASGSQDWRNGIYLRSIRAVQYVAGSRSIVASVALLPWLARIDSVDVRCTDDAAGTQALLAFVEHFGTPGLCPRHVVLSASAASEVVLRSVAGRGVRSLDVRSQYENGKMARLVGCLQGTAGGTLEALDIHCPRSAEDLEAVTELLVVHGGASLRSLMLDRIPMASASFSFEAMARIVASVNRLTRLCVDASQIGAGALAARILAANSATLVDVDITATTTSDWVLLPQLLAVWSLTLQIIPALVSDLLPSDIRDLRLDLMHGISRLSLVLSRLRLDAFIELVGTVHGMKGLRELALNLDFHSGGGRQSKAEVSLRVRHLRLLDLLWKPDRSTAIKLSIVDWKEIEMDGLPQLEEAYIRISNVDPRCATKGDWTFPRILHNAIVDGSKTPALACVKVELTEDVGDSEWYDGKYCYQLSGGRSRFRAQSFDQMRRQYRKLQQYRPLLQDVN